MTLRTMIIFLSGGLPVCWLHGTSVQEKDPLKDDYLSRLARKHKTSLQSESIALFSNAVHVWYWQRRSFFCVSHSSPHKTIGLLLLSTLPTTISELDKTTPYFTSARDDHGSFPRKS